MRPAARQEPPSPSPPPYAHPNPGSIRRSYTRKYASPLATARRWGRVGLTARCFKDTVRGRLPPRLPTPPPPLRPLAACARVRRTGRRLDSSPPPPPPPAPPPLAHGSRTSNWHTVPSSLADQKRWGHSGETSTALTREACMCRSSLYQCADVGSRAPKRASRRSRRGEREGGGGVAPGTSPGLCPAARPRMCAEVALRRATPASSAWRRTSPSMPPVTRTRSPEAGRKRTPKTFALCPVSTRVSMRMPYAAEGEEGGSPCSWRGG